jgi:hypothetical protein
VCIACMSTQMLCASTLHKASFVCPVSLLERRALPNLPFIHGVLGFYVRPLVVGAMYCSRLYMNRWYILAHMPASVGSTVLDLNGMMGIPPTDSTALRFLRLRWALSALTSRTSKCCAVLARSGTK